MPERQPFVSNKVNISKPEPKNDDDLDAAARSLIRDIAETYDESYGFGSMSCAVYDTAWVSLVTKTIDGQQQWLFPQCFYYLLDTQSDDGSWGKTTSQIDGIMSTAASLLSLLHHQAKPLQLDNIDLRDVEVRIEKASISLHSQLQSWAVISTVHVGFEVIVPALLDLLAKVNTHIDLQFVALPHLMKINKEKLSGFKLEDLYGHTRLTILHSLEAFMDKVDFDRIAHHKTSGSMMGSPSSTAAYLMSVSTWDDEAETYLNHVIKHGAGRAGGGVPSAYPSTFFEFSWVLSTLLTSGFSPVELVSPGLNKLTNVLSLALDSEGGAIGFAPNFIADVDDTAKSIVCLKRLGKNVNPAEMIRLFEGKTHFKTYPLERNPSLSANCNALLALLHQDVPRDYSMQIMKMVKFLGESWWDNINQIKDKWNLSYLYPTLLFVEAVMKVVHLIEKGSLDTFGDTLFMSKLSVCLYQACYRTLLQQDESGSWNNSVEETAYGILILCEARRLDLFRDFEGQISSAIDRAAASIRLLITKHESLQPLWIEKVSYTSPFLTESYRLAALKAATIELDIRIGSSLRQETSFITKLSKLWLLTPLFSKTPEWQLRASMVEGTLFWPIVRAHRLSVFTRKGVEEDKYFNIIPLAWPTCSNRTRTFVPPCLLFEGMMSALLNYQVDEYFEAIAAVNYGNHIPELRRLIDDVVYSISIETGAGRTSETLPDAPTVNGNIGLTNRHATPTDSYHPDIDEGKHQEVLVPLRKFATRVLKHPAVLSASFWDRKNLTCELRIFLQAQVTQNEDNIKVKQNLYTDGVMREHFFRWVRTTSADHTSATYTFNFVSCLLGSWIEAGNDCFPSTQEKYYAAAVCQHLASMCRMYNDHGSTARDYEENNLNSIDFPEFKSIGAGVESERLMKKKDDLFEIAQYERSCLEEALRQLEHFPSETASADVRAKKRRQIEIWRMFYDVTDFFGQIYILRDIGVRLTAGKTA